MSRVIAACDHRDAYGSTIIIGRGPIGDEGRSVCMLCDREAPFLTMVPTTRDEGERDSMTAVTEPKVIDDLGDIGRRLAELFPVSAQHRGWMVSNLVHSYERTPYGVEEAWSADIYGPTDISSQWHRIVGQPRISTLDHRSQVTGTVEAPTAELLIEQVRRLVKQLGLEDLTEPDPLDNTG